MFKRKKWPCLPGLNCKCRSVITEDYDSAAVDLVKSALNHCQLKVGSYIFTKSKTVFMTFFTNFDKTNNKADDIDAENIDETNVYRQWLLTVQLPKLVKTLPATLATSQFGATYAKLAMTSAKAEANVLVRKRSRCKIRQGKEFFRRFQRIKKKIKKN